LKFRGQTKNTPTNTTTNTTTTTTNNNNKEEDDQDKDKDQGEDKDKDKVVLGLVTMWSSAYAENQSLGLLRYGGCFSKIQWIGFVGNLQETDWFHPTKKVSC
jgi:hypothetical protein